jgi:hypothetical protein
MDHGHSCVSGSFSSEQLPEWFRSRKNYVREGEAREGRSHTPARAECTCHWRPKACRILLGSVSPPPALLFSHTDTLSYLLIPKCPQCLLLLPRTCLSLHCPSSISLIFSFPRSILPQHVSFALSFPPAFGGKGGQAKGMECSEGQCGS